jgi:phospholipase C
MTFVRVAGFLFLLIAGGMLMGQTPAGINPPAAIVAPQVISEPAAKTQTKILEEYGKLPLSFESNQGQTDPQVKFLSRSSGYTLFLTTDEAVFSLRGNRANGNTSPAVPHLKAAASPTATTVLRMKILKANSGVKVTGSEELPGKSHYFVGNDPRKWYSNVPNYSKVKFEGIYPGIDLVYYGNQRRLDYDFIVAPGADPHTIVLDVRGARKLRLDGDGDLVLVTDDSELRWRRPVAYQEKDGTRQQIAVHYVIAKNRIGFAVAGYDLRRTLFIDPLVYSTYLGGSGEEIGHGITLDTSGNAYVAGETASINFPTMNPTQSAFAGGVSDAFVTKFNPAGSALVYSTYLGGSNEDIAQKIAVDGSGDAFVTGVTSSTNFPTSNPLQPAYGGGPFDAFVAELNPSGSALVYSTYLGGSGDDEGNGIAVDSTCNAYITGGSNSTDFPTMDPLQPASGGGYDAFVAKINSSGSALVYSTYLGGSDQDIGQAIATDSLGDAYVTGQTYSANFPTMNPLQPANGGSEDAFVAQINPAGSALIFSTYLGGSGNDEGNGIALNTSGNAYVTGDTTSSDFPTMNPLQPANGGGQDAFVAQLNSTGSALVYSTYLGGSGQDIGEAIAVDSSGDAYVTGQTYSTNFPTMNPFQPTNHGLNDAFMAELNSSGSALVYSTYLGGSSQDSGEAIAVDNLGNAYVTGFTSSTDFPTMNPLQPVYGGGQDAFVTQISTSLGVAVSLVPANLNFGSQTLGIASSPQNSTLTNLGELALNIASIQVTGTNTADFAETNNCPASLPPSGSCQISVTFTPSAIGVRNAAVSIADNAPNTPQSLPLTGVGVLPNVTFSPPTLSFGNQGIGTASTPQMTTLTNAGAGVLSISSIGVSGTNSGDFAQTNNCPASVPPSGSCQITVTFTPTRTGNRNAVVSVADNAPGSPQSVPLTGVGASQITQFQHVIVVVQENRTTDNLFLGLCGTNGSFCPNPYDLQGFGFSSNGQKIALKKTRLTSPNDPLHDHPNFLQLCDLDSQTQQCKMDGANRIPCHVENGHGYKNGPNCSFEYADPAAIQPYLTLVQQYGFANYMFSTSQGGSFAGHQFLFSGTSAPSADDDAAAIFGDKNFPWNGRVGCTAPKSAYVVLVTPNGNEKAYPCFEHNTIPDILPSNVSWRYYVTGLPAGMWTAPNAIKHICQPNRPYDGQCLGPEWINNVDFASQDVLTDISACNLRNLSWVIPSGQNSDHPGKQNDGGPSWVASIVNAIGAATTCDGAGYWSDTAIIVTWDDFGGFYDHVPPPILPMPQGDYQLGARVPLLFISAYTPAGYVDNNQQDFGSILRFIEQNWEIPEGTLNFADARAINDLTTFFNLNVLPRTFLPIPAPKDANFFLHDKRPPEDPDDD